MPEYVEWTRNTSGRIIKVATIDKEICDWWQVEVHDVRFNQMYDSVSLTAISVLMRWGGSTVTEVYLNAYLKQFTNQRPAAQWKSFCREFLLHRYTVRCWHSRF